MKKQDKINLITIAPDISMLDTLKLMDKIDKKLLIVQGNESFMGLLSIGDIQRAIINNIDLETPIQKILRKNIKVAHVNDSIDAIKHIMMQFRTECIPVLNDDRQLVDVFFWEELFNEKISKKSKKLNTPLVIMAGGKGTRLKPFSNIIPKPLFPLGEGTIIEKIIENFHNYSIPVYFISINHKADMIKQYLKDNLKLSIEINYVQENEPLGTAGSLSLLKDKLENDFFVSNCDIIIHQDYGEIYDYHVQNKNDITIVAALKHYTIPYGTIETGIDGRLIALSEKPEFTHMINSGMYILNPNVLSLIPENSFYHITELIDDAVKSGKRVGVFPVSEKSWSDIGEWQEYKKTLEGFDW